MNSKRKSELQRKLTLASVPRPPADLAGRIKADIPHYLKATQEERERFSRSIAFNFRVAASILLLFSSLFVCLHLITRERPGLETPFAATLQHSAADARAKTAAATPTEEVRVEMTQAPASAPPPAPRVQIADATVSRQALRDARLPEPISEGARENDQPQTPERKDETARAKVAEEGRFAFDGAVAGSSAGGVIGGSSSPPAASIAESRRFAPPQPFASAPAVVPVPVPAPEPMDFVTSARAATFDLGPRDSVFGITIDPEQFQRLKTIIERGDRPKADSVNVEALVNYFAGASPRRSRGDVGLEVEASPAPVGADGHRGIVRFTIDTASADIEPGSSNPPAATNASIDVEIDDRAVTTFRAIGDHNGMLVSEAVLQKNMSVTGLYEVTLRSDLSARQRVATVTLSYRSISTGRAETITHSLYGRDFTHKWTSATRRHRLASLGAVWGETLKGTASGTDVARRAEELAKETKDERAKELAQLATASSRIRTSTPTGSGR